jgi:two-component system, NarL family, nitrate/nitrite response regulator NarL
MASLAVFAPSPLFRAGLAALVGTMGFDPVQEAADLGDLARRGEDAPRPDLFLIALPKEHVAIAALMQEIRAWAPDASVVFIAPSLDTLALSACFAAGASGYLVENMSREGLKHSLLLVSAGEKVFPTELASLLTSGARISRPVDATTELRDLHATDREIDTLRLVAQGDTNRVIAKEMGVSTGTVSADIKSISRKLKVSNRVQAALWAAARGLARSAEPPEEAANGTDARLN